MLYAAVLLLALCPLSVQADLIVNWGGDYVSGDEDLEGQDSTLETGLDLDGDAQFDDSRRGRLLSFLQAMNPQSGYSGVSDVFYGGASKGRLNNNDPGNWNRFRVTDSGSADLMEIRVGGGASRAFHYLQFWEQADFLTLQTGNLGFTTASNLLVRFDSTLQGITEARWVVREGSTFYLSEATIDTSTANSTRTLTFASDASDGNWAVYSPSTSTLDLDATASFSSQNFSNITAVGFYLEKDAFSGTEGRWTISDFEADLALVPEPSAFVLLAVAAVAGVLARTTRGVRSRSGRHHS